MLFLFLISSIPDFNKTASASYTAQYYTMMASGIVFLFVFIGFLVYLAFFRVPSNRQLQDIEELVKKPREFF